MLSEKKVAVDVLWVLTQLQSKQHDPTIERFIQSRKARTPNPSYLPGVFPDSPKIPLSEEVPSGTRRFITYLQAPLGKPQETARRHLKRFVSEEADGYVLTHQLIVLLLAEQAELPLSPEREETKRLLLEKIYREQAKIKSVDCIDLYMERIALLLFYGNKQNLDPQAIDNWIRTLLEMQRPDGSWPHSKTSFPYDGENVTLSSPRSHTTVLAMMALQAYLNSN